MKKTVLILFFSIFFTGLMADGNKTLVVQLRDGSTTCFSLSERPRIVFEEEIITITSISVTVSFPYSTVGRFYYEGVPDRIDTVSYSTSFARTRDEFSFSSLPPRCTVYLYSLEGLMIDSRTADLQGQVSISIGKLPSGVYILRANGKTYKILKR